MPPRGPDHRSRREYPDCADNRIKGPAGQQGATGAAPGGGRLIQQTCRGDVADGKQPVTPLQQDRLRDGRRLWCTGAGVDGGGGGGGAAVTMAGSGAGGSATGSGGGWKGSGSGSAAMPAPGRLLGSGGGGFSDLVQAPAPVVKPARGQAPGERAPERRQPPAAPAVPALPVATFPQPGFPVAGLPAGRVRSRQAEPFRLPCRLAPVPVGFPPWAPAVATAPPERSPALLGESASADGAGGSGSGGLAPWAPAGGGGSGAVSGSAGAIASVAGAGGSGSG